MHKSVSHRNDNSRYAKHEPGKRNHRDRESESFPEEESADGRGHVGGDITEGHGS